MKSFKIVICILAIAFSFSGCMPTQNLSHLTVVQGIGIDLSKSETRITIQYLNLSKTGGTQALNGNITAVADGNAKNISDALSSASKTLSKKVFFGQNKIIVFGSDYVKEHMTDGLNYLFRSVDGRPDVLVAMSDKKAEDIIRNKERESRIPAQTVYDLLEIGEANGLGATVTVNEALNMYSNPTSDLYFPVLTSNETNVACKGIAVFSKEKYADTLNAYESFGFLFINNKIDGGTLLVSDSQMGIIGLEIISSDTKKSVSVKGGEITFNCDVSATLVINELENGFSESLDQSKINKIQVLSKKRIKSMCTKAFEKCVKSKSDPYMIGRYLAKADGKYYDKVKDNWRGQLSSVKFNIRVDTQVKKVNDNSRRQ